MLKKIIVLLFLLSPFINVNGEQVSIDTQKNPIVYTYQVLNKFPHDPEDFTEGLYYENGIMYESTGKNGASKIKKYELKTGKVIKSYSLPIMYFGEGATILGDKIYQLTWKARKGFIYDKETLKLLGNFSYKTRGWGLTNDGKNLIMTDGTEKIYFIDPVNFNIIKTVMAHDGDAPIVNLNELEYIDGKIYANIFLTDFIAIINPENGSVEAWIDLTGLLKEEIYTKQVDVLNGIAYDNKTKHLLVTGKYWPFIFEIKLIKE